MFPNHLNNYIASNKLFFLFLLWLAAINPIVNAQCGFTASIAVSGPTAGCGGTTTLSSVSSGYSNNVWVQKASMLTARTRAVCFSVGNKGYIGSGESSPGSMLNDLWEYDPASNTWTQKASLAASPPGFYIGFGIGTKGYIVANSYSSVSPFYEYDPASNTWTQKATPPNICAIGFSIGSKGYLVFGNNGNYWLNTNLYEYNPTTNTWTQKASHPGPSRSYATGFSIGSKGYVGLGVDASNLIHFYDFCEYDPATDHWTVKATFPPTGSMQCAGFSIGNKGYIGTGFMYSNYVKDFWEYDPAINHWTQRASFGGVGRANACGFSIAGKGYIGMGDNGYAVYNSDLWEYTPAIALNWSTGSTLQTITATSPGTYSLILSEPMGCSSIASQLITLSNPSITLPSLATICAGNSYTINPAGAGTYTFSGGNNVVSPQATTSYTVIGTSSLGCTANAMITVVVYPLPTVSISGPAVICSGNTATLNASGASTYSWNNGTHISSLIVTPAASTVYSVSGTSNICTSSTVFSITVMPTPTVSIASSNTLLCAGESATLSAGGSAASYSWSNGMSGSQIIVNPSSSWGYMVTGTNPGNCSDSVSIIETVSICNALAAEKSTAQGIRIYPNPSQGVFTLEGDNFQEDACVFIYDVFGRLIYSEKVDKKNARLDISTVIKGIYTLQVSSKGRLIYATKLVKD